VFGNDRLFHKVISGAKRRKKIRNTMKKKSKFRNTIKYSTSMPYKDACIGLNIFMCSIW
jgi:hypothetical protein